MAKKYKGISKKDLKARKQGIKDKINKAVKAGDIDRVEELQGNKRGLTRAIQKRGSGVEDIGGMNEEDILEFVKNDPRYKTLSPEQKESIGIILKTYDYASVDSSTLTKAELKALANYAAKVIDPAYDQEKKEITEDYEIGLSDSIDDLNTGLERSQEDLQKALDEGDSYKAEEIKKTQTDMQNAIKYYETQRDEYVTYKRQYLQEQIAAAQSGVETGIGRATEDELRNLRQQERQYKTELKDLQTNMQQRGYAWSSERTEEEGVLGEENVDMMSAISSQADRQKMDAVREAENLYGSEAVAGIEGASQYLRGGVQGTNTMASEADIADALARYGESIRGELSTAEGLMGSDAISKLYGDQYGSYLTGGIEGSIERGYRQERDELTTGYGRDVEDDFKNFARNYGYDAAIKAFGQPTQSGREGLAISGDGGATIQGGPSGQQQTTSYSIGALDGIYGGYTPPSGQGYGRGYLGRKYNRDLRYVRQKKRDARQAFIDQEKSARQDAYKS